VRQIVAQGTRVVARARSATPVTTVAYPALAWVPLTGGKWVQGAQEIDQISGQITYTHQPGCEGTPNVDVFLDKSLMTARVAPPRAGEPATATSTRRFLWRLARTSRTIVETSLVEELFEPGVATPHQLTAEVSDGCTQSHMTVNALSLDVVGVR
jgi:hypothetical protein